jgi:hypothetical protein
MPDKRTVVVIMHLAHVNASQAFKKAVFEAIGICSDSKLRAIAERES